MNGESKDYSKLLEIFPETNDVPDGVETVVEHLVDLKVANKSQIHKVASDYYDWSLELRQNVLKAPSIDHLCKSIIFENTRYKPLSQDQDFLDPMNSQYYLVMIQYTDKINTVKLRDFVRALGNDQISKKNYNLRLASEEKAFELTGFVKYAVCPFGMTKNIPIITSKKITQLDPPMLFIGAGHIDWKLALPLNEFLETTNSYVVDLD